MLGQHYDFSPQRLTESVKNLKDILMESECNLNAIRMQSEFNRYNLDIILIPLYKVDFTFFRSLYTI